MAKTQKTQKVSEQERLDFLQDFKRDIQDLDPNISASEAERRAAIATGLAKEGDQPSAQEIAEAQTSKTKKAASGVASAGRKAQATMSAGTAQKWIFGIMVGIVSIQLFNDIIQGRNRQFDVIPRRIFAGSLAGILLMLLAVVMPRVALGLAVLMALTTLFVDARASGVLQRLTGVARGTAEPVEDTDQSFKSGPR